MTEDDRFFATFGKFVCFFSFLFVLLCAFIGVALMIQGEQESRTQPTFVIPPDSAPHKAGAK